jgi:hypothetical protein
MSTSRIFTTRQITDSRSTCFAVRVRGNYRGALGIPVRYLSADTRKHKGVKYYRSHIRPDSSCFLQTRCTPIRGNNQGADRLASRYPGHRLAGCLLRENREGGQTGSAKNPLRTHAARSVVRFERAGREYREHAGRVRPSARSCSKYLFSPWHPPSRGCPVTNTDAVAAHTPLQFRRRVR